MRFSTNWNVVSDCSTAKSGIILTATHKEFKVINLNTGKNFIVPRERLVSANCKYRNEVLCSILKSADSLDEKELNLDKTAANLVDELCEANRLLY